MCVFTKQKNWYLSLVLVGKCDSTEYNWRTRGHIVFVGDINRQTQPPEKRQTALSGKKPVATDSISFDRL